ncbi:MAG: polysaccharide biosynthesis tyrosine autokinase [Pirellulales bacterium]
MERQETESPVTGSGLQLDILGIVRRRFWWLVLSCILGLGVGSAYYFLTPKKYESRAELLLMQNDSGDMASGTKNSESSVSEELLATHMKIIQSNRIVAAALNNHGLAELESIVAKTDEKTTAVEYVIDNLYVTSGGSGRARNAHVLNVAFRHTSPEDCEKVMKALVTEYQEFVKVKFQDINIQAANLITKAREELEDEITKLEKNYREFRMQSPLLSHGQGGTDIYTVRYEELAAELSQLAIQQDEAAGRLKLVKEGLEEFAKSGTLQLGKTFVNRYSQCRTPRHSRHGGRGKAETAAFQALQPERMAGATAEYSSLLTMKSKLKQLLEDFGQEHPEVRALQKQISEMETFLDKRSKMLLVADDEVKLTPDDVMKAYVSMLEHDLRALEQRSLDIEKQMESAESKAKELVAFQLEDESLIRERSRHEDLYNAVIERLKNINMQKDAASLIQEAIEEPVLGEKVEPRGIIAAAISMLSALLFGAAGALVGEFRDRSVHDPAEFEKLLGSRVMAHLPNFQRDPEIRKLRGKIKKLNSPLAPTLLTHFVPDSRASESFRALRTQALFGLGGDHRILAVTSANQGAGKSMIASNLAVSMANAGQDVLLIDCDMRLPQVHKLFGVSNESGLAELIGGGREPQDVIQASQVKNLSLLTSGDPPVNPAELLSSPQLKNLLDALKEKYTYVILDCPPVLPVSDPSIIAPIADGVLLVAVADAESRPKTSRTRKILDGVGAKILGVVINRSDDFQRKYEYRAYGYESNGSQDRYFDSKLEVAQK